ncbi:IclR family transcriptional regulator [Brachybacterium tyrofermentans]
MGMIENGASPAVHRALSVLEVTSRHEHTTPGVLAEELGLAKSSVADIVSTMVDQNLLRHHSDGLGIGRLFEELTSATLGSSQVLGRFASRWQRHELLAEHTVTVQSVVGTVSLCLEARHGSHLLPCTPRPGLRTDTWTGAEGEPILRALQVDDVLQSIESFELLGPELSAHTRNTRERWIHENSRGGQTHPMLSSTGNLEMNVRVALPEGAGPTTLTLHLAPQHPRHDVSRLHEALSAFAAWLVT